MQQHCSRFLRKQWASLQDGVDREALLVDALREHVYGRMKGPLCECSDQK